MRDSVGVIRKALESFEWVDNDFGGGYQHCPGCRAYWGDEYPAGKPAQERKDSHAADCIWMAALTALTQLQAERDRMTEVVEAAQQAVEGAERYGSCDICGARQDNEHYFDCRLGQLAGTLTALRRLDEVTR